MKSNNNSDLNNNNNNIMKLVFDVNIYLWVERTYIIIIGTYLYTYLVGIRFTPNIMIDPY